MNFFNILKKKIIKKKAVVSIIGLGYVGLPLSLNFIQNGFNVIGIDQDPEKIISLKKKRSYISSIRSSYLKKYDFLHLSDSIKSIKNSDIIIYCLPTPINRSKKPNLKILRSAASFSAKFFSKGQMILLESTTYPGCTEDLFLPLLKKNNLDPDSNFFISYSPEREDPGNKEFSLSNTPKIVSGIGKNSLNLVSLLYENSNVRVHRTSNIKTAEMTKLLENTYRNINIGFVNEMKIICRKLDLNVNEIIQSAKTKPFGYMPFYPGPGVGGHCIPVDPHYLLWKLKKSNYVSKFIEISSKINDNMPNYIFNESFKIMSKRFKNPKELNILFIGLSYKKNIDDLRESPSLTLIKKFVDKKFSNLFYHDPFYSYKIPSTRNYSFSNIRYSGIDKEKLKNFQVIFLLTDHDNIKYDIFKQSNSLIFDTRNRIKKSMNVIQI